jgi:hypothetical protein
VPPPVPRLTLRDLRQRGLLEALANAFDDRNAAAELLDEIDFPAARRPVFANAQSALYFWTDVCREVEKGITPGGLDALLRAAATVRPDAEAFAEWRRPSSAPLRLLFLSACPPDMDAVRYGHEWDLIRGCLTAPDAAVRIEPIAPRFAVGPESLFDAISTQPATILHFSGHGAESGHLVLEDERGRPVQLSVERLAQMLKSLPAGARPRLVCLASCYLGAAAEALCEMVEAVVGSRFGIPDDLALAFVRRFYHALASGPDVSIAGAVEQGKVSMATCADNDPDLAPYQPAGEYVHAVAAPGVDLGGTFLARPRPT